MSDREAKQEEAVDQEQKGSSQANEKTRDGWTYKIPTPVHWVLSLLTVGLWAIVWRGSWKNWVPATLSGFLLFLSFADWDIWPFGFIFMVPLLYVASRSTTVKKAFWWSWWTGLVSNFGGFWWITGLLIDFGRIPVVPAFGICVLMTGAQGIAFGIFGALFRALYRRGKGLPAIALAPLLWAGIEVSMPFIFPYYLSNSQYSFPIMIQTAEIWGPIGVSALLLAFNGAIFQGLNAFVWGRESSGKVERKGALVALGVSAAILVATLVYGGVRMSQVDAQMEAAKKLRIGMVEADIGIESKGNNERLSNNLLRHHWLSKKLVEEQGAELLVWPESSYQARWVYASTNKSEVPDGAERVAQRYRYYFPYDVTWIRPSGAPLVKKASEDMANETSEADRNAVQRGFEAPILFGSIRRRTLSKEEYKRKPPHKRMRVRDPNGKIDLVPRDYRVYNSAILLDKGGEVLGAYDKTYLLAFGEYVPLADWWPGVYKMIPSASEFTPGDKIEAFTLGEHRLGIMICYEDILPNFGRQMAKVDPHVLINITNDAWFGKTSEPYLHLALATFRSVETRKWLLRSTNTGVTAFVDANGRIVAQTDIYEPETLVHDVAMMTDGPTIYVMIGDVVGYVGVVGTLVLLLLGWLRRKEEEEPAQA